LLFAPFIAASGAELQALLEFDSRDDLTAVDWLGNGDARAANQQNIASDVMTRDRRGNEVEESLFLGWTGRRSSARTAESHGQYCIVAISTHKITSFPWKLRVSMSYPAAPLNALPFASMIAGCRLVERDRPRQNNWVPCSKNHSPSIVT
jgi:hypothetical protein